MVTIKRTLSIGFIALVALSLLWFAGGKNWADKLVTKMTESKDEFTVPAVKIDLNMIATQDRDEVTVCNHGAAKWDEVLIRVNGGYLVKIRGLTIGNCARIKKTSFLSTDWKHLPAPRDLDVTEIEVLSRFSAVGYAKEMLRSSAENAQPNPH
jgi:hypothetical protein